MKFRPVIELTAAGLAVMKGVQPPPGTLVDLAPARSSAYSSGPSRRISKATAAVDEGEQLDPEMLARFEKLRSVRLELARQKQLPPYVICHDSTLKTIASVVPRDLEAMQQIKGMGPYKIEAYGQAFLDVMAE